MEKTTDPAKLADAIASLRYDDLHLTLKNLSIRLMRDAAQDQDCGRTQLAMSLAILGASLDDAATEAQKVWAICKPYMEPNRPRMRMLVVFPCTNCRSYKEDGNAPCGVCGFIPPR